MTQTDSLFKNNTFLLVWFSGLFVMLGFSMFFLSVSWFVVDELNNPGLLGVVLVSVSIPRVAMMIYGGILADRIRKSFIMFVTNLLQALLMLVLVLLVMNEGLTITSLLIISFVFGFLDAFFFPAVSSMMPVIVTGAQLQRANSLFQGSTEMMFIIGPLVAGVLLTVGGFTLTFGTAGVLILLSGILVFPPFLTDPKPEKRKEVTTAMYDLKEGIQYVRQSAVHRSGTLAIVIVNLFMIGPLLISFPILVEALGGSPLELSLLEAGLSVGTFLASLLIVVWNVKKGRGMRVFVSLMLSLLLLIVFSLLESLAFLVIAVAVAGFMAMFVYLPTVTLVQERTEKQKMGRVMSIISLASSGFEPVAFAIIAILVAAGLPIQTILFITGVTGLILAIVLTIGSREFRAID